MADIKSPEERSRNMSKIRSKDTKPEVWLRKRLFNCGYRYRKNVNNVIGHPDIWMPKFNTAVFVNGCFWHRHKGCKFAYTPKSRVEFWDEKFRKNVERDLVVKKELETAEVKLLIVWECTITRMIKDENWSIVVLDEIKHFLQSDEMYKEL